MTGTYRISSSRLSGIAEQARRLADTDQKMTPAQIQTALEGVTKGDYMTRHYTTQADTPKVTTEVKAQEAAGRYYYNGILLPKLPEDALKEYPYCVIRDYIGADVYDLFMSKGYWYYDGGGSLVSTNKADGLHWYQLPKTEAETAATWPYKQLWTAGASITADAETRPIIWTNCTIREVSTNTTTNGNIYLEWSLPVTKKGE